MEKEYILCAAIWYLDIPLKKEISGSLLRPINIDKGAVFCGYRHPHCLYTMVAVTGLRDVAIAPDAVGKSVQGFLTSKNRFVDRKEGAKIFVANGGKLNYSTEELFSEDLYPIKDSEEKVTVPKNILIGLYRIMCGISSSFSGAEVYKEAIPGMNKAYEFIINYGKENKIDSRGLEEHNLKK